MSCHAIPPQHIQQTVPHIITIIVSSRHPFELPAHHLALYPSAPSTPYRHCYQHINLIDHKIDPKDRVPYQWRLALLHCSFINAYQFILVIYQKTQKDNQRMSSNDNHIILLFGGRIVPGALKTISHYLYYPFI